MSPRILITGDGMLGSALYTEAQRLGHDTTVHSHEQLDVTDAAAVLAAVKQHRSDIIFHTAALTKVNYCEEHPQEALRVNATGTDHVVAAAQEVGARLVYFSTDYVFPGSAGTPIFEDAQPAPLNQYGASKLAGEQHVAEYELGHIMRLSGVFGPRADRTERNFFRAVFEKLSGSVEELSVVDDQITAISFAPHVAAMLFSLLQSQFPPMVHLTSRGSDSWFGWAQALARQLGADTTRIVPVPTPESSPVARPRYSVLGSRYDHVSELIGEMSALTGIEQYAKQLAGH